MFLSFRVGLIISRIVIQIHLPGDLYLCRRMELLMLTLSPDGGAPAVNRL